MAIEAVWRRHAAVVCAVLTGLLVAIAPPAAPPAAATTSITGLYVDGPTFNHDVPANLDASASWTVTLGPDPSKLSVNVANPTDSWGFVFESPIGTSLTVGTYDNVMWSRLLVAGRNGADVSRHDAGCVDNVGGQFTVLELTTDASGTVTSAAVDFALFCQFGPTPGILGSIRFQSTKGYRGIGFQPAAEQGVGGAANVGFDLGTGLAGVPITRTVTVTATGSDAVAISSISTTGTDFSIQSESCPPNVAGGASCQVVIAFKPGAASVRSGTITFADNALAGGHQYVLSGMGVTATLSADKLNFGTVDVDTGSDLKVTLHSGSLGLTGISTMFNNNTYYSVAGSTCGTALAANSSCTYTIRYMPLSVQTNTAQFSVGADQSFYKAVSLSGTGRIGTKITWAASRSVGLYRWNDGASLARTTTSTAAYLHEVSAGALVGSKPVTDTGPYEPVYYSRSSNGGGNWGSGFRLNPTTQHGDRPTVAAAGAYVYAAWVSITKPVHYSSTAPRILYVRVNHANGATTGWGSIHRITSTTGRVDFPVIAASGGSAYLTWTDSVTGSIRLSVSHDHGATWTTTTMGSTTRSTPDGRDGSPFVAVDGSRATIAWTGDANGAVVTRTTTNGGGVWTAARTLATTSNGLVTTAVRGTRSAVAWSTGRTIQVRILSGSIWGAVLSTTPPGPDAYYNRSWFPAVALQGTTSVAVAFSACVGPCPASSARLIDVVWAESLDGGGTWKRQVIGFYNNGGGPQKVSPSVVWATPTLRYVMWNGQPFDGGLGLAVRTGSGAS